MGAVPSQQRDNTTLARALQANIERDIRRRQEIQRQQVAQREQAAQLAQRRAVAAKMEAAARRLAGSVPHCGTTTDGRGKPQQTQGTRDQLVRWQAKNIRPGPCPKDVYCGVKVSRASYRPVHITGTRDQLRRQGARISHKGPC